jgi:osmotically-inducible protein OsmY
VDVTENVTTALLRNELLKGAQITVITTKGDVRLVGVLTSQAQIDAALATARTTDGVHALHNELTLKP